MFMAVLNAIQCLKHCKCMLVIFTEKRLLTPVSFLHSNYKANELETRHLDVTGNNPANVMLPLQNTA